MLFLCCLLWQMLAFTHFPGAFIFDFFFSLCVGSCHVGRNQRVSYFSSNTWYCTMCYWLHTQLQTRWPYPTCNERDRQTHRQADTHAERCSSNRKFRQLSVSGRTTYVHSLSYVWMGPDFLDTEGLKYTWSETVRHEVLLWMSGNWER